MNNLKSIRKKHNMSIAKLSEKTGITSAYISMLENGKKHNPSLGILKRIAEALNTPLSELI